tara:strand:- start:12562 stop:13305 length:744 start_codon:yes stop_codon:yes gene_type:complete
MIYLSKNGNAVKTYDGPSLIDGKRIVVILTGLKKGSANTKTGGMIQSFIMPHSIKPNESTKTGDDASVCGNCPQRPLIWKATPESERVSDAPCYVVTMHGPRSTWVANVEKYDLPVSDPEDVAALLEDNGLRLGTWGDPSAVPASHWAPMTKGRNHTGYTHQQNGAGSSRTDLMASVHSEKERQAAKRKGFRTFRIISSVSEVNTGEILCPASKEAGAKTDCNTCNLCMGDNHKKGLRARDVAIVAH